MKHYKLIGTSSGRVSSYPNLSSFPKSEQDALFIREKERIYTEVNLDFLDGTPNVEIITRKLK